MERLKEFLSYVLIVVVVVLIRTFIATPVIVDGDSMNPTLADRQVLILYKIPKEFARFDIVVIKHRVDENTDNLIKRVVGLPGENVKYIDNKLYINDEVVEENFIECETADFNMASIGHLEIPEGYYFVVGDNRKDSLDSRIIGLIPVEEIKGKVIFSIFPFNRFGKIEKN